MSEQPFEVVLSQLVRARRRDVKRLARFLGVGTDGGRLEVAMNVRQEMRVRSLVDDFAGSRPGPAKGGAPCPST